MLLLRAFKSFGFYIFVFLDIAYNLGFYFIFFCDEVSF